MEETRIWVLTKDIEFPRLREPGELTGFSAKSTGTNWPDLQLDDLTRNHCVFIERVNGAEPMIAVRDDHFALAIFPDEE